MIAHEFDNGWGPQWMLKKLEQELVRKYLRPLQQHRKKVAVINSTWYSQTYHQHVLDVLRKDPVDAIVLVAMLDPAIPKSSWYREFDVPVFEVGYYAGDHELDFWAVMAHRYMDWSLQRKSLHQHDVDRAFMCLNRKPHPHRVKLYRDLERHDLLDHGIVSLGGNDQHHALRLLAEITTTSCSDLAPNSDTGQHGIVNDIAGLGDATNWRRHFLNIVTETEWDIGTNRFVSEKIYKPLAGKRPFLLFDPDGGCSWLRQHGFLPHIDDFRDITDLDLARPENVAPFLVTLVAQGRKYWKSKLLDLDEKMRYNRQAFGNHYQRIYNKLNQGIQCQI